MPNPVSVLLQHGFDMILERMKLPRAAGGANDHIIRHAGEPPDVHQDDVFTLCIEGRLGCKLRSAAILPGSFRRRFTGTGHPR